MTLPPLRDDPSVLKVLDLGRFIAGPVAATLLGDFGAEVIKVERREIGDMSRHVFPVPADDPDMSYEWQIEGRNKRSITLDFTRQRGQELLRRLAQWADVLVENFVPGTMERWGLGYDDLAAINPRLVYVSVSGFGATGPYRGLPGFDFVGAAFAGLMHATGVHEGPPTITGYAVTDQSTAVFAALGALEAIRRRDCVGGTGRGDHVDMALYESVLRMATPWIPLYEREGIVRERETSLPRADGKPAFVVWGYVYEARDGRWLSMLPPRTPAARKAMADAMGRPELMETKSPLEDDAVLRSWIASVDANDALATMRGIDVPCGPVNTVADICADEHVRERSLVTVEDHRGVPITMQGVIPRLTNEPGTVRWAGEPLGASNDDIYCGLLGLSRDELDELLEQGIV